MGNKNEKTRIVLKGQGRFYQALPPCSEALKKRL